MGGYAWVTLATNDSYSLGALVLAHSLKQVATQQQLAVLITPGVTNSMRSKLGEIFNVVKEVNILDSKDEANLRLLKRPELGITFTKLHCWRLTQFEKCVFLDADTLVLENCDELFEREELSAAPDIGWPDCFNSGVFVYRPSEETYEKLINFALEKGSFDGGDQGLLNLYFSDWAHKDISKHLPFIYNMASTSCYSYLPAFKQFGKSAKILHFIGSSKPWLQYFNTETRKVHPSEGLQHLEQILQHWWNIFCNLIHPALSPDMAGLAGAFANLTLGKPRTPEQQALDDHLRRQGWEVGNIDYLGRDSFDNIWSKICETLSLAPEPESTPTPIEEKLIDQPTQKEASPEKLKESTIYKEASPNKAKTAPLLEPDKTEFSVAVPASRIESKEENKLEATAELLSDRTVQENKSAATLEPQAVPEVSLPISNISDTITPKVDSPTTTAQAAVDNPTATFQVAQVQIDAKLVQTSDIAEPSPEQQEMGKQLPEPLKSTPPPATTETISKPVDNLSDKKIPIASETTLSSLIETQPQSPESPRAQEVIPEEASKVTSMEVSKDVQAKASEVISVEPEITKSVDPINQEVTKAIPTDESKSTPADSFKVTPADSFKAIPAESPKTTPAETSKDTPVESLKATPTDNPKTTPEEIKVNVSTEINSVKTAPVEILKTSPAEISVDTLTVAPVETPKSPPKDPPKVSSTETIKDAPKPKPSSTESLIAKPSEMSETAPIESVSTVPVETSKATSEILESVPVETPKSTPVEKPDSKSVETSKSTPTKLAVTSTTMDASVKTSKSVPTENVKAVPKGTQNVETAEAPKGESKKSEESVPKKVSKGKQTPETKEVSNQARQKETTKPPASKVTEPTPPTTPGCPTPQSTDPASSPPFSKGGLQVEGSVPNTPPAQEAASGPTPPPRKSASAPKKAAKKK
ncbi:proteoglycan 4 isoform X3 [Diorhabda sublineata]|uniref:proteoglycan 4 isoform X3 n=1 Tax=Diorhabda sublineata TaxID=1163346 RepID=UPI0024E08982|nr:proteoglycan 4 isoform X3 [Diorhabda sublineata]